MAFNLKDDARMRQRLQGAVGLASPKDIDAPAAELPPLDAIQVEVQAPAPPSEADILARYKDRLRALATVTPRATGDVLELGDEVCISTVGHAAGLLVPGSIRHEHWIDLAPDPSVVGFCEQLVGVAVGASVVIPAYLDAPKPKPAVFAVRVLEARSVDMPHPEHADSVARLGLAPTLEATLEHLGHELLAEAEQGAPLLAMNAVMRKLAEVAVVEVSPAAVDAEIQRAWRLGEGDACAALALTVEEQQEALKLWLGDPAVRADALSRLKSWAALKAIVAKDGLTPSEEGYARFFEAFAPATGQTPAFLRAEVDKDPRAKAEIAELAFHMQVVDYVVGRVRVDFVD